MKYKDLPSEEARKECKKHAYKKNKQTFTKCDDCPLRRTRTIEDGTERTLFCYYRLQDLITDLVEDWEELRNEEIKHWKEIK